MSTACGISLEDLGSRVLKNVGPNRLACCLSPACPGQRTLVNTVNNRLEGVVTTNLLVTSFGHATSLADMSCVRSLLYSIGKGFISKRALSLIPPRGLAAEHFRRGEVGGGDRWNRRSWCSSLSSMILEWKEIASSKKKNWIAFGVGLDRKWILQDLEDAHGE